MVLAIDTAGPVVGVALWSGEILGQATRREPRGSDSVVLQGIQQLLTDLDQRGESLSLVAVTTGPGAFIGLRVGVSAALGVSVSRGVPVAPVSSLQARAALASGPRTLSLLDARKQRVYGCTFDTRNFPPVPLGAERDVALDEVIPGSPFVAVGEGARVYREQIEAAGGGVHPEAERCPLEMVARLGWAEFANALQPEQVALRYLRHPDVRTPSNVITRH
ncbi:MAG: tRNA (adenosine(37)-N6)-threonylcarbamoyltransferase complex dimerization subunit type 1 TsaB [Myxococcota bacterium]|nr:tRNA (adenosine(37)-N6)-threonylcarbamoyltransferase complex dimerization subunit type 1 TsaB [Myxococcota bacterium]